MTGEAHWFGFVLGVCATWRVAHLLTNEDGPWELVVRLRAAAGDGVLGRLLDCFYCLSVWIAAPIALTIADGPIGWVIAWLAISGAACLLERMVPAPTALLHPITEGGDGDGLLRPATRGSGPDADEEHTHGTGRGRQDRDG